MESIVKQRLIKFLKYKGLSQKRFESIVGLSNGYVNNIRRSVTEDKLQKIVRCYPELSKNWLLFGEGEMLNQPPNVSQVPLVYEKEPYTENKHGIRYYRREDGALIMEVRLVPYHALASPEDEFQELVADEDLDKETFIVDKVGRGKYVAFRVEGDSMDDGSRRSFSRGDSVLVRELDKDDWLPHLHINKWRFWVVVWGNNIRLKEIVKQEDDTITLHSLNPSPEYTDFVLKLSEISRLYNVIRQKPHEVIFG